MKTNGEIGQASADDEAVDEAVDVAVDEIGTVGGVTIDAPLSDHLPDKIAPEE